MPLLADLSCRDDAAMLGQGVRVAWESIPSSVRDRVAAIAGGAVVGVEPCAGGFSPGAAVRLQLDGGRRVGGRVFAKAVSTAQNPRSPGIYRVEVTVNGWLPDHPAIPRLLGTYDDGDWVALVFECVDAAVPVLPWRAADLGAVLDTMRSLHVALTPAPGEAPTVGELHAESFTGWRSLLDAPLPGLDDWSRAHLPRLAALESEWATAADGDTLLHSDLRADNVLVRDGRAWVVDWPWACVGAPWVDAVFMAPSVVLQGGPEPEALLADAYPGAPADRVLPVVAALAGYFTRAALQPAPDGLPTVRAHQASCGRASREWLARLAGTGARW